MSSGPPSAPGSAREGESPNCCTNSVLNRLVRRDPEAGWVIWTHERKSYCSVSHCPFCGLDLGSAAEAFTSARRKLTPPGGTPTGGAAW